MSTVNQLLMPYRLNAQLTLKNRIVMAPMTRCMADDDLVPTDLMAQYYARRASVGLIVTEGTIIRRDGLGYPNVPGIYNSAQIAGWRKVTDAVHRAGGKIFLQIWHVGRVTHPNYLNGQQPLSPSATDMSGQVSRSKGLQYGRARALEMSEIKTLVDDYAKAAQHAMLANFDGVEIHGANGYLIDQFLHHSTNLRTDAYGGNPEKMARFALEVIEKIGQTIGYERVGIRLSPGAYVHQVETNLADGAVFKFLLTTFNNYPLAYVHTGNENDTKTFAELDGQTMTQFIRQHYKSNLIAAGSYDLESAKFAIDKENCNLVAIGRPLIANHDLIEKIQFNLPWDLYHPKMLETLY